MNSTRAEGQLIQLDEARKALAKVVRVDEAKKIRDKAEALRNYAKQQKLGLESQNHAAEIKIRAERRAGELLAAVERAKPGPRDKRQRDAQPGFRDTIESAGISEPSARRWQKIASIPEPRFEQVIATVKDVEDKELTSSLVASVARSEKPVNEAVSG